MEENKEETSLNQLIVACMSAKKKSLICFVGILLEKVRWQMTKDKEIFEFWKRCYINIIY